MKLVDNLVGRRRKSRTTVVSPSFRIGVSHIQYGSPVAVYAYSLGKRAWTLALADVKGVEHATKVALDSGYPTVVAYSPHLYGLDGFASLSVFVYAELGGRRRIKMEHGLCLAVFHLIKAPLSIGIQCKHCGKKCRKQIISVHVSSVVYCYYLAISETAKPPPRASLIFSTSPFLTVLCRI